MRDSRRATAIFFKSVCAGTCSLPTARDCSRFFILLMLAILQRSQAYVTVSMNSLCKQNDFNSLKLSSSSATSLLLDTLGSACRMEIIAPEKHHISLLSTKKKKSFEKRRSEAALSGDRRTPKCMLTVSFPLNREDDVVKLGMDLCSEEAFSTLDQYIDVLPPRVTLEWNPSVRSIDEILASEVIVAPLGKGRDICSQPDKLLCNSKYPIYCISKELVCDGKRNCPEGSDEDEDMCSFGEIREKNILEKTNADSTRIGHDWELVASEVLKKLSSKDVGHLRKSNTESGTERATVLWSEEPRFESEGSESLPDVLKHYGPWGYLMLGMLICGAVLMFCGLWECCCRKPKSSASNPNGPTLLIINQGAQQGEVETPQTPGPPRYEDLDQPPSYATLFPSRKDPPTNVLPITIPIVDSLSNLLTNSSSSHQPPENTMHSTSNSIPAPEVFTIEFQRESTVSESSPK